MSTLYISPSDDMFYELQLNIPCLCVCKSEWWKYHCVQAFLVLFVYQLHPQANELRMNVSVYADPLAS